MDEIDTYWCIFLLGLKYHLKLDLYYMDFHLFLSLKQCFWRKCLVHQQFFDHFVATRFFQLVLCLVQCFLSFRKMVSQSSKKAYYRLKKRDLRCWKSFLFLFNKGNCNSFFISYKTLRMICLLFKVNLFQVKPPHYGFP